MNAHTHTLSPEDAATAVRSPGCGGSGMGSPAVQARAAAARVDANQPTHFSLRRQEPVQM